MISALSKTELRKQFRDRLTAMSPDIRTLQTANLNRSIVSFMQARTSGRRSTWAAFQPHGFEPDIRPALTELTNIEWAFPKVIGDEIGFYKTEVFIEGAFGIQEPHHEAEKVSAQQIDGLLVPGLVFDTQGTRLGRGRGFYDRLLTSAEFKSKTKIGIAFDNQIAAEALPSDPHDIPMDLVLTDAREIAAVKSSRVKENI